MNIELLNKPASELTAKELSAMLASKREAEREEKAKKKHSYEQLRNEMVEQMCSEASHISGIIKDFGTKVFADLGSMYELLQEYSSRHEGGKGNFMATNADNTMRVKFRANKSGYFDERSVQAEKHIKDFITTRFSGDEDTKAVIGALIERRRGHLDINLVQRLYTFEDRWDDANWQEGIKLLKESWTEGKTRFYVQFEVQINERWMPIVMDFAALCNQNS